MKYWLRMGGPNAITLRAWLLLAPISIFFSWLVVPEGLSPRATLLNGLLVGLLAHVVTGFVLWLGKTTLLRNAQVKPKPVLTISIFAIAGAARGFSAAYLLQNLGIVERANFSDRMLSGAILVVVWFAISAVLVDGERRYKATFSQILEELEKQSSLRTEQAENLKKNQEALMSEIRSTLAESLKTGQKTKDFHGAVDELIRPLAHRIATANITLTPLKKFPSRRIKAGPVIWTALHETAYSWKWTILMSVISTFYTKLWQFGPSALVDSAITAIIIWSFFVIAKRLNLFGFWVLPIWFITGFTAGFLTTLFHGQFEIANLLNSIYLSVTVTAPAAIVALIGAFDRNTEANLNRLRDLTDRVAWEAASLEQRSWVEQQRIARFVHSELQARLRAFALRLDISGRLPTNEEIEALKKECEDAFPLESQQRRFEEFVDQTLELWEGVVEISVEIEDEVFDALASDTYATTAAEEITKEAILNAVRHGKARNVVIQAHLSEPVPGQLLINIVVIDDGNFPNEFDVGMGLKEIEQLSVSHSLFREENKTKLIASITCAASLVSQS